MGGVVAVGVVFEEGEVSGLLEDDDDDRSSVLEVVVVVDSFLPSPFVFWVLLDINLNVLIVLCGVVNLEMFSSRDRLKNVSNNIGGHAGSKKTEDPNPPNTS